ncbi:GNAT family N-acetyltransferase [Moritella dasanensis]|uniref:GNAT family N-acetyltransferase n=1 Tax=Moritella dasanensis TaxID=428031 RepID=UPI0003048E0A|nr:GNAT family N-acetyltransferase [Moritella dasanensis]
MILRKATVNDIDGISQLISTLVIQYIFPTCSKEGGQLILNSMTPNNILAYLKAGYEYHVAEINAELVGVVGIKNNSHLYHLFIADSQQGKGLSRTLWEMARDVCLANGNTGYFTVNSALNATGVYLKFGFEPTCGVREKFGVKDMPMELHVTR